MFFLSGIISIKYFLLWKKEDRESRELIERDKMDLRKVSTTFLKWWTSVTKVEDDLDFWGIPQNPHNLTVSRGPELVWGSQTRSSDATWYGFLMKPKQVILDKRGVIPMANRWRWRDVHTNSNSKVLPLFSAQEGFQENPFCYSRDEILISDIAEGILILFTTEGK